MKQKNYIPLTTYTHKCTHTHTHAYKYSHRQSPKTRIIQTYSPREKRYRRVLSHHLLQLFSFSLRSHSFSDFRYNKMDPLFHPRIGGYYQITNSYCLLYTCCTHVCVFTFTCINWCSLLCLICNKLHNRKVDYLSRPHLFMSTFNKPFPNYYFYLYNIKSILINY